MKKPFRITGRHVLAGMVGFFLVIIAVNAVFITLAVRSFPGEKEEKSYLQGLHYNETLKARAAQAANGWTAEIRKAALVDDRAVIELTFKDQSGAPIYDLDITGVIARPADDDYDQEIVFTALGGGLYTAELTGMAAGAWALKARAEHRNAEPFEFETKLYLE